MMGKHSCSSTYGAILQEGSMAILIEVKGSLVEQKIKQNLSLSNIININKQRG